MKRASIATPKKNAGTGKWGWVFSSAQPRPDGSRRQIRRSGFPTRAVAQAALDKARREDGQAPQGGRGVLTVAGLLEQFIRTKRLAKKAPGTIAFYEWSAGHAIVRWGGWDADKLSDEHLDIAYLEAQQSGRRQYRRGKGTELTARPLSARSVEAIHKTLKAAYALAVHKGQLTQNPAELATPPAVVNQRRQWWDAQQVGAFLAHLAELGESSPLPLALVDTLVDTGGRRGELLGLRWCDIDLDAGTVTIARQLSSHPSSKALEIRPTKRPRSKATIGLHPATVAALRKRRIQQHEQRLAMGAGWPGEDSLGAGLVFTWPDGRAIHPDALTAMVGRLSVQAGLPRLTPHGLRHSFASAALAARVPVEVVAARLGNTPRVVQEVYAHVIPADDQGAAQLVGDLYRAARKTS